MSSHSGLYKWMRKITKAHPGVTLQALRRAVIRTLYEGWVSPQLAAKLAGNSVQSKAKHYVSLETLDAHSVVDSQARAAQKPAHEKRVKRTS